MEKPVQVTFRGLEVDDAIEAACRAEAEKLERYFEQLIGCRVVVSMPHRHHRKGNLYHVSVELSVPGKELAVNRVEREQEGRADWLVALHEAFGRARRLLEDYVGKLRGNVKAHAIPEHGRIVHIEPLSGLGRLLTPDGRELTFHRSSVLGDRFDQLGLGAEVRFNVAVTPTGPHATAVQILGRHHHITG